jgi:hypothetical protein
MVVKMVVEKLRAGLPGGRPSPPEAASLSVMLSRRVMQLSRAQVAMCENHRASRTQLRSEPAGVPKRPTMGHHRYSLSPSRTRRHNDGRGGLSRAHASLGRKPDNRSER